MATLSRTYCVLKTISQTPDIMERQWSKACAFMITDSFATLSRNTSSQHASDHRSAHFERCLHKQQLPSSTALWQLLITLTTTGVLAKRHQREQSLKYVSCCFGLLFEIYRVWSSTNHCANGERTRPNNDEFAQRWIREAELARITRANILNSKPTRRTSFIPSRSPIVVL